MYKTKVSDFGYNRIFFIIEYGHWIQINFFFERFFIKTTRKMFSKSKQTKRFFVDFYMFNDTEIFVSGFSQGYQILLWFDVDLFML